MNVAHNLMNAEHDLMNAEHNLMNAEHDCVNAEHDIPEAICDKVNFILDLTNSIVNKAALNVHKNEVLDDLWEERGDFCKMIKGTHSEITYLSRLHSKKHVKITECQLCIADWGILLIAD